MMCIDGIINLAQRIVFGIWLGDLQMELKDVVVAVKSVVMETSII